MKPYVAFFDDSGNPDPSDKTEFFTLGMVVIPFELIQETSQLWWDIIRTNMDIPANGLLPIHEIEAKSSDLYNLYHKLHNGANLTAKERVLIYDYNVNLDTLQLLIRNIWECLSNLYNEIVFLGAVANKNCYWEKFKYSDFCHYQDLIKNKAPKDEIRKVRVNLQSDILSKTYQFLLQRLQYLMEDIDRYTAQAIIIGDETSNSNKFYVSQAYVQAGLGNYTDAPNIINNVFFGSSLHNPGLQIADWIAFAIRSWAMNQNPYIVDKFHQIKHKFRNKDADPFGRGIVLVPNATAFPAQK